MFQLVKTIEQSFPNLSNEECMVIACNINLILKNEILFI